MACQPHIHCTCAGLEKAEFLLTPIHMRGQRRARVVCRRRLPGGLRALRRAAGERAGRGEGEEGEGLGEHGEVVGGVS